LINKSRLTLMVLALVLVASASAATIELTISGPYYNLAQAEAARAAWAGSAPWFVIENFEGYTASQDTGFASLFSPLGTFQVDITGSGSNAAGTGDNEMLLLDPSQTRFSGRYNTTPGGNQWLDSNDITNFTLDLTLPTSTLFFFMTDVEDVGNASHLMITVQDSTAGSVQQIFSISPLNDGATFFVGIRSDALIQQLRWFNEERNDGFGLDDFGTLLQQDDPVIPEPSTYILLGSALLGAAFLRRHRR
jgi:hypothetical protein